LTKKSGFKILAVALFVLIQTCSFAQENGLKFTPSEEAWIAAQDTLYFGYDPEWMPYEFVNDKGEHDGITKAIIQRVHERSGLNLKPYPGLTWSTSVDALKSDHVQLLACLGITDEREEFMSFTSNYLSSPFVIINAKDGKFVGGIEDIQDLRVALPKGYLITEKIEKDYPEIDIIYTNNIEEAFLQIITNRADVTLDLLHVASYYMNYKGFDNLQIAANVEGYEIGLSMAVLKGNDTLQGILEKSLNDINLPEKQKVINEWVTVTYEHGVNMTKVWTIASICALVVLIVIGVIIFWNRSLKREITARKEAEEQLNISYKEIHFQKDLVDEKNREITDSIKYAKRIQSAILPPNKLVKEHLKDSFVLYKPKDIVAGDFYWLETKGDRVLFAAADCTGHGVPGAMVSVVCNNGLNRSVREYGLTDPAEILNKTREIVIQEFEKSEEEVKDGMDIAICSLENNVLKYAGANNPLWIVRDGDIMETKANKQPIGKFMKPEPFITHTFNLEAGDTFYIFSDGFIDQFGGEKGKKFKAKNFKDLLLMVQDLSMEDQKTKIDSVFYEWMADFEQLDDVCVIGVRV
jgi:serine phosphatase RsbU (regulator of sigma subunit)